MKQSFVRTFIISVICLAGLRLLGHTFSDAMPTTQQTHLWKIKSIDTMKHSRDLAREKAHDATYDAVIEREINAISASGATYVAIATPYDEEFIPILKRWVTAARQKNLHIWFRGNFSGWERWFDYPAISREEHRSFLSSFITSNKDLFADGDLFTSCPECENGGPGDPRKTGDIDGHRAFLISEHQTATDAFRSIGVAVSVGYYSMNYDVAKQVMNPATTAALGGIVTIDHYVASVTSLKRDITAIAASSQGSVFLGEFGVPIPDINGHMSEQEQAQWIEDAGRELVTIPHLIGVNYWVNAGGSTALWTDTGTPRKAVTALTNLFTPTEFSGRVVNQIGKPIMNVKITSLLSNTNSDKYGRFILPIYEQNTKLRITCELCSDTTIQTNNSDKNISIIIPVSNLSIADYIFALFYKLTLISL